MGRDKLALPWRGATVLTATLAQWTAVGELAEILLVRRAPDPTPYGPRVRTLVNAAADEGLGSSLRAAAGDLPPDTAAVVVGLADMPAVRSATIAALVAAFGPLGPDGIVAPRHAGRRGHPVVFGARHLAALRALRGDEGARALLAERAADLVLVDVDDPGVLLDLDVPADRERQP
jgi:molybdenum cofactor cytidylyltransferase